MQRPRFRATNRAPPFFTALEGAAVAVALLMLMSSAGEGIAHGPQALTTRAPSTGGVAVSSSASTTVIAQGVPAWLNVAEVSVQKHSNFIFELTVGANIPSSPAPIPGDPLIDWQIALDTDPSTAAVGWPCDPFACPAEYTVYLWWDNTQFAAGVANRTPLLNGGNVVLTPISFSINDNHIRFSIAPALLGNPSSMGFFANTELWTVANVQINSPTNIVVLPSSFFNVFEDGAQAPFPHFGAKNCDYTDNLGFVASFYPDCWEAWSLAKNHHHSVEAHGSPGWMNERAVSVTGGPGGFSIAVLLQNKLPSSPRLFGNPIELWTIGINTDPTTAPNGWPLGAAFGPDLTDYFIMLWWDGANFAAMVADRTPELTGGSVVLTAINFSIINKVIQFSVPAALLGNPSAFGFAAVMATWGTSPIQIISPTVFTPLAPNINITYFPSYAAPFNVCSWTTSAPAAPECYTAWP